MNQGHGTTVWILGFINRNIEWKRKWMSENLTGLCWSENVTERDRATGASYSRIMLDRETPTAGKDGSFKVSAVLVVPAQRGRPELHTLPRLSVVHKRKEKAGGRTMVVWVSWCSEPMRRNTTWKWWCLDAGSSWWRPWGGPWGGRQHNRGEGVWSVSTRKTGEATASCG
jgi:hypothetical protein